MLEAIGIEITPIVRNVHPGGFEKTEFLREQRSRHDLPREQKPGFPEKPGFFPQAL